MGRFTIKSTGWLTARPRLVANELLLSADFDEIAAALGTRPLRARKVAIVAASLARAEQTVATHWEGKETSNVAAIGDYIVTTLDRDGNPMLDSDGHTNHYVLKPQRFDKLYEPTLGESDTYGPRFRPKGIVEALAFPGGFDILAPWGERQRSSAGYILRNGAEVYGNAKVTFEETYEILTGA